MRWLLLPGSLALACVSAPQVVIVDRHTSLEQQAAGSYLDLNTELDKSGVQPGPVPYTKAEVQAAAPPSDAVGAESDQGSDAARIDNWLVRLCVGEGLDGTLVETDETCPEEIDPDEVAPLVERTNRIRRQVWAYLETRYPQSKPEDVRKAWREARLREIDCKAQMQMPDGKWDIKKC